MSQPKIPWWRRLFRRSSPARKVAVPELITPDAINEMVRGHRVATVLELPAPPTVPEPLRPLPAPPRPVAPKAPRPVLRDDAPRLPRAQVKPVEEVLKEDAAAKRGEAASSVDEAYDETEQWQVGWTISDDPKETVLKVAQNESTKRFAVVIFISNRWRFWTGPRTKLFTPLGQGEIWTAESRDAALIIARFLQNGNFGGPPRS